MKYNRLANTDLSLSEICLGTMTWGKQNTLVEAHEQIDFALSKGVNFLDMAEMYPIPPCADTCGDTERFVGGWLKKNKSKRKNIVIATKVAGKVSSGPRTLDYIRKGPRLNKEHIHQAVDASLKKLQTDYIDLYQIHWPERYVNIFGRLDYDATLNQDDAIPILETLEALDTLVKQGKVRHIGVSNETAWGLQKYIHLAEKHHLSRIVSIQNAYNLLNRYYEISLSEVSMNEACPLLAYSPLAFGVLSGKYFNNTASSDARINLYPGFDRYKNKRVDEVICQYLDLADKHNLSLTQISIAFLLQKKFIASTIIGATNLKQLKENIATVDIKLSPELIQEINRIHHSQANPCP